MRRTDDGSSDSSISLSWKTDTPADCVVYYGPYRFYGLQAPATSNTVFYIGGNNASPQEGDTAPLEGELYEVEEIIIHPDDDIALVKLSEAVSGVTPAGYNTADISSYNGSEYSTAGFDADPFYGITSFVRVDSHSTWIAGVMSGSP
jgi:hypothetical protein